MKKIAIKAVQPDSAAHDADIRPGDFLISINGQEIEDIFDYRFLTADTMFTVEIEKKNGELWEIDIEKDEYEDFGLEFEDPMISGAKSCSNKCIFCFIDQLPKGMRDTVYFKDDDSRLSFLTGNYVTLTNMKRSDIERLIRYRMTPVNVSVHTTNPELRRFMLGNRFAGDIKEKIKLLIDGGIDINAQIVLCRDINDGAELDRTLKDLSELCPGVNSISVVPVGLTKWRDGLYGLKPFDAEASGKVLEQVGEWQKRFVEKYGTRLVYLADEFYIKAGAELPQCEEYEDFPQIENGVGLMSLLIHEFHEYIEESGELLDRHISDIDNERHVSIATGVCAYEYIKELAQFLEKRYNSLKITVFPIKNDFFGENVTVTGLLTGCDLIGQLTGQKLGNELLISRSMLKSGEDIFLDDVKVRELSEKLKVKVTIVENSGEDFINKIAGI
jgi:putative radical SAM enzyme (TIGR03279 family)